MRYRNQRRGRAFPKMGADVPAAGSTGMPPQKTTNWMEPDGPTQGANRSLGMPRIKTRMRQKGV